MKTPEEQWWVVRAGEYVLGTLRGEDLKLFEKILAHDTTIQSHVREWDMQFSALNKQAPQQTPRPDILPLLIERIRNLEGGAHAEQPQRRVSSATTRALLSQEEPAPIVATLRPKKSTKWWPVLASVSTAACFVLAFLLQQQTFSIAPKPFSVDGVAIVLSDDDGSPYFLVETDYGSLQVRVTALSPPDIGESQDLRLWQALPDRSAVRPVALLPEEPGVARVFKVSSLVDGSDLFGVSIEPVDAATTDGPTGPVVAHGDYLVTRE